MSENPTSLSADEADQVRRVVRARQLTAILGMLATLAGGILFGVYVKGFERGELVTLAVILSVACAGVVLAVTVKFAKVMRDVRDGAVLQLRGAVASVRGGFAVGGQEVLVLLPEPRRVLATCEGREVVARVLQRTRLVVTANLA